MLKSIKKGFTLVELAIVGAILAALAAAVFAVVNSQGDAAETALNSGVDGIDAGVTTDYADEITV